MLDCHVSAEKQWKNRAFLLRARLPKTSSNAQRALSDRRILTEALPSLPIWPRITLEATPLATHLLFAKDGSRRDGDSLFIGDQVKLAGVDVISTNINGGSIEPEGVL